MAKFTNHRIMDSVDAGYHLCYRAVVCVAAAYCFITHIEGCPAYRLYGNYDYFSLPLRNNSVDMILRPSENFRGQMRVVPEGDFGHIQLIIDISSSRGVYRVEAHIVNNIQKNIPIDTSFLSSPTSWWRIQVTPREYELEWKFTSKGGTTTTRQQLNGIPEMYQVMVDISTNSRNVSHVDIPLNCYSGCPSYRLENHTEYLYFNIPNETVNVILHPSINYRGQIRLSLLGQSPEYKDDALEIGISSSYTEPLIEANIVNNTVRTQIIPIDTSFLYSATSQWEIQIVLNRHNESIEWTFSSERGSVSTLQQLDFNPEMLTRLQITTLINSTTSAHVDVQFSCDSAVPAVEPPLKENGLHPLESWSLIASGILAAILFILICCICRRRIAACCSNTLSLFRCKSRSSNEAEAQINTENRLRHLEQELSLLRIRQQSVNDYEDDAKNRQSEHLYEEDTFIGYSFRQSPIQPAKGRPENDMTNSLYLLPKHI